MAAANAFLPSFVARHNLRFARTPARPDDLHRPLVDGADRLRDVLCWRDQRYVGQQLTFSYERKRIMLAESEVTRGLVGKSRRHLRLPRWPARGALEGRLARLPRL